MSNFTRSFDRRLATYGESITFVLTAGDQTVTAILEFGPHEAEQAQWGTTIAKQATLVMKAADLPAAAAYASRITRDSDGSSWQLHGPPTSVFGGYVTHLPLKQMIQSHLGAA